MKAFIDTSSLIKKYIQEKGSDEFDTLLEEISEIIVAPSYFLEIYSALHRRLREKTLSAKQLTWVVTEAKKDLDFFSVVRWNENLEQQGVKLIHQHHLKTLDSIQLASACLAKPDFFLTSDIKLHTAAKKEQLVAHLV